MYTQTGHFPTSHASKYLQQLCKHFAHKVEVTFDTERGEVAFPFGRAELRATDDALHATVCAQEAEVLVRARAVIDSHLKTFAFREVFTEMTWDTPAQE